MRSVLDWRNSHAGEPVSAPAQPTLGKFDVQTSRIQGGNQWLTQINVIAAGSMVQFACILTPAAARALAANLLKQAAECETAIITPASPIV
jgi:hypothetical protein